MKTRLVSFFFIIGLLPMKAQITEQYYDINNTCWRFTELTDYGCSAARITEIAGNVPGDIVIPSAVSAGEDNYLVVEVGEHVFSGKKNIASINIPNTIQTIGYNAFYECSNLYSVMIPSIEDWCKIYFNGYYSNPLRYATRLLVGGKVYTSLEIPETVTTLNSYVFAGFKELKSIVLPDNLIAIGQYAFENCSNLTTVVLPSQLTSIGPSAFHGCKAMTSLELPDGLASIGDNSFTGCSGLTSIVIPSSVSSIGKFAFYGCDNLQTVTVKNSLPLTLTEGTFSDITNTTLYVPSGSKAAYEAADYWKEFKEIIESSPIITFADPNVKNLCVANWDTDGDGEMSEDEAAAVFDLGEVFKGNTSITSFDELVYFNGLTSIGKNAFLGCNAVKYLTLPNNLMMIKQNSFDGCTSLQSVTIPASVEYIYQSAFANCSRLQEVRVLATTPPLAYDNTFSNYNVTLSVPEASIGSYQATSPWSNFTTLQTLSGEEPTIEKCEKPTILYANGELTFGCATEGVEFHWTITNGADSSGNGSKVSFTPKTTVSVYVSKDGYKDSDTATLDINGSGGLKGDVNNNGGIDIGDAVTIVNYLVGKTDTLSRGTGVNENMKEPQ